MCHEPFAQYNRISRTTAANVRLRWQLSEGHDVWMVYNDLLNNDLGDDAIGQPRLPRSQARAFLVQYTRTFIR